MPKPKAIVVDPKGGSLAVTLIPGECGLALLYDLCDSWNGEEGQNKLLTALGEHAKTVGSAPLGGRILIGTDLPDKEALLELLTAAKVVVTVNA
jgi:hypothetical protein